MLPTGAVGFWTAAWLWGLLLITLSLVVHASGLGLISISLTRSFGWLGEPSRRRRESLLVFPVVIDITALLPGVLHGLEASLWAVAYVWLGASPDFTNAVFFYLQMITTLAPTSSPSRSAGS
jgi:hypothetical protein